MFRMKRFPNAGRKRTVGFSPRFGAFLGLVIGLLMHLHELLAQQTIVINEQVYTEVSGNGDPPDGTGHANNPHGNKVIVTGDCDIQRYRWHR